MNAVEVRRKPTFKRARKNSESSVNEVPKFLYAVIINNDRLQKKETWDKISQEIDKAVDAQQIGLPPQPKGYLKFPDYDWF